MKESKLMNDDLSSLIADITKSLNRVNSVSSDSIPDMPLYMDQVRTFMEGSLHKCKRRPDDKILTKTMINNYAKNSLLPPPDNKRYSKEHIMVLIFIYYFKQMLSMNDIQKLMDPIYNDYFGKNPDKSSSSFDDIYSLVMKHMEEGKKDSLDMVLEKIGESGKPSPSNAQKEDYLKLFFLICDLLFDIYSKKVIVEKLIDILPDKSNHRKK